VENIDEWRKSPSRRRSKPTKQKWFEDFDRSPFMWLQTDDGRTIYNRARSMLHNGHRPSAVALNLYQNYGVKLGHPTGDSDPERDGDALYYFSSLVVPDDPTVSVSIFDEAWGQA
jgi:hypothetical protein